MEGLNDRLDTLRWFGAKLLKPMKRSLTGNGKMISIFHSIRAAREREDYVAIRDIYTSLRSSYPYYWSNRYEKHVQLVALCRFLLAEPLPEKTRACHALLALLHDNTHELTREILRLVFGLTQN